MRKASLLLIVGVLIVASMQACSPAKKTETPSGGETVAKPLDAPRPKGWSLTLEEIPEISNKQPIHVGLVSGVLPEYIQGIIDRFAEHTGVSVTYESISTTVMYPKVNLELLGRTGTYDVINPESSSMNEWAEYLYTYEELANRYEPGGWESLQTDIEGHHPSLLRTASDAQGNLLGLPFYYYTATVQYRADAFEHPVEKENFKKKYGYELAAPTTWEQIRDQAEFFTRKKGDLLKGEVLDHDVYGVALMAGRYEINDELFSMMRSKGATWAKVERDAQGKPSGYVITLKDMQTLKECLELYKACMPFTPPGTLACFYDLPPEQLALGNVIMAPTLWGEIACRSMEVADNIPGARIEVAPVPGKQPYFGAFSCSVPKDSKNPEAAYWFSRYLASYEGQDGLARAGWNSCRADVMRNPEFAGEEWSRKAIGAAISMPVLEQWDAWEQDVDTILNWNSKAAGKIYEEQIIMIHSCIAGSTTPGRCVKEIVDMTVQFQEAFGGGTPIRVEPELEAWLKTLE